MSWQGYRSSERVHGPSKATRGVSRLDLADGCFFYVGCVALGKGWAGLMKSGMKLAARHPSGQSPEGPPPAGALPTPHPGVSSLPGSNCGC